MTRRVKSEHADCATDGGDEGERGPRHGRDPALDGVIQLSGRRSGGDTLNEGRTRQVRRVDLSDDVVVAYGTR